VEASEFDERIWAAEGILRGPLGGGANRMSQSRAEQNVRTAAKMYEMRETARSLFGASYSEKVEPWKAVLAKVAESLQAGPIEAALMMANPNAGHGHELNEFDTLLLISAAMELCEGAKGIA
jgi:hypothetical protein